MKIFQLPWAHLHRNLSGKYRVSPLLNDCSSFDYLKRTRDTALLDRVYVGLVDSDGKSRLVRVALIFTDPNLLDISLPNGNFKDKAFESISYATNEVTRQDATPWPAPRAGLPRSETEGNDKLTVIGNTFGNVPPKPLLYVPRPDLEKRLKQELLTKDRHPIVTLTGPGGIGKTTIALEAVHRLAAQDPSPYEVVLWISARDIDLLDTGPKQVSRRVFTKEDISRAVVGLLEPAEGMKEPAGGMKMTFDAVAYFEQCLAEGPAGNTLFVLDNFETLQDPSDTVRWLDAHIRPPNKVLITTRFRNFVGDYPIEIGGMQEEEAVALIEHHSKFLDIRNLIAKDYMTQLIKESEGHPYVIKMLLGQVAKEGRAVNPRRIVAASDELLGALFQRTYDALSPGAQRVFLLLSSWRVFVPEVAVEAVCLRPSTERFDVSLALEELVRFSLVERIMPIEVEGSTLIDGDDQFVGVPLAATLYGQRELKVSPLKIAVEEDRKILMEFGAGRREDIHRGVYPRIENIIRTVANRVSYDPSELSDALPILEFVASKFHRTYWRLADLVLEARNDPEGIEQAKIYVRQFLMEADVTEKWHAWIRQAELCRVSDDAVGEIHAICEAALLPTTNSEEMGKLVKRINYRIRYMKSQGIDEAWSSEVRELIGRVTEVLQRRVGELSATDLSGLAWLYLNVGNEQRALSVTKRGIELEPDNMHCQKLMSRLDPV